jgi:D-serine deaminase-like pyridoxal phosphate-dependent protein
MDISLTTHKKYLNRPATDLPTPALIISRPVLERNVARLHSDVEKLGIAFRPHVKTLKARFLWRIPFLLFPWLMVSV